LPTMSPQSDSNQRPSDYKSEALPTELWRLNRGAKVRDKALAGKTAGNKKRPR
jgi:hypothetical protein